MNFFKKKQKEEIIQLNPNKGEIEIIQEKLEDENCVSFERVKEHLVDLIEENRKLKEQEKRDSEYQRNRVERLKKEKELAVISADEYRKRNGELEKEIEEKNVEIRKLNMVIEEQKQKLNDFIVKEEMMEKGGGE